QTDDAAQTQLNNTLYTSAEALRIATALLGPVLPQSAPKIWAQLGITDPIENVRFESLAWGQLPAGQKIGEIAAVFPRIEVKEAIARMQDLEEKVSAEQAQLLGKKPAPPAEPESPKVAIDDFLKVDLRVGLVVSTERVKGS